MDTLLGFKTVGFKLVPNIHVYTQRWRLADCELVEMVDTGLGLI